MGQTAHRMPPQMAIADTITLGDLAVDAIYLGEIEVYSSGPSVPVIYTTSLLAMTEGDAFSQQIFASGNPGPTFSVTAGTIAAGLSLSSSGLITGTPTTPGAYDFTVTATNTEGSDPQQYTGTVAVAPLAPVITTTTLDPITEGSAFSQTLAATGDTPITWTVTSGTIPAGLSLSASGEITGTPVGP